MRPAARILATLLLLAACSGGDPAPSGVTVVPAPSTVSPRPTPSVSVADPSPSPSVEPVVLPPGVPASFPRDDDQADLPLGELVPADADVTGSWFPDRRTLIVTWGVGDDPFRREQGLVVWRRTGGDPPWVATYAFRDPERAGVLGIQVETGDVTGDGAADAIVFEHTGGSGACGTWSVVALSPEADARTYSEDLCDASVELSGDPIGIRLVESVFGPDDPHCCPSGLRTSTLEWNGTRWRVTSTDEADL